MEKRERQKERERKTRAEELRSGRSLVGGWIGLDSFKRKHFARPCALWRRVAWAFRSDCGSSGAKKKERGRHLDQWNSRWEEASYCIGLSLFRSAEGWSRTPFFPLLSTRSLPAAQADYKRKKLVGSFVPTCFQLHLAAGKLENFLRQSFV